MLPQSLPGSSASAWRAASLNRRSSVMAWVRFWVRVVVRRGIASVRPLALLVASASRVVMGAVGRHRVGNSSRLPGWVV